MSLGYGIYLLVVHGRTAQKVVQRDLAPISRVPNSLLMREPKGGKSWLMRDVASVVSSNWKRQENQRRWAIAIANPVGPGPAGQ